MATVLIADDVKEMREFLAAILISKGFEVIEASSGPEVMQVLQDKEVDLSLMLIDIEMPALDGIRAVKIARSDPRHKNLKICFISGSRDKPTIVRALAAGGNEYLVKPIDPQMLMTKIVGLLGGQKEGFATAKCHLPVTFKSIPIPLPFFLVEISEQHAVIVSQIPLEIGKIIDLDCPEIAAAIGFEGSFQAKTVSISSKDAQHSIKFEFVALHESVREKIRSAVLRQVFEKITKAKEDAEKAEAEKAQAEKAKA